MSIELGFFYSNTHDDLQLLDYLLDLKKIGFPLQKNLGTNGFSFPCMMNKSNSEYQRTKQNICFVACDDNF